ncbi:MAG: hypothetical protein KKC79_18730, partial [Gammaproteobacteria bacterium]|nr:hypothetical protein [Gammaproteobacteria bacterium]
CSPTFNWREVPVADASLIVLLPCKADRASRALPLGGASITVDLTGCEAGGATFAVAHASAADAAQADGWMQAWRAATKERLAGQAVVEAEATLPRAARAPAPTRLDAQAGQAPSGAAGQTHVIWFAQQRAGGVSIYQATVLGNPSEQEAVKTFFEGLRLQ